MDIHTEKMIEHLRCISARVLDNLGDISKIREIIEDYSKLDEDTRRVDAKIIESRNPPGEWVLAANSHPERRLLYLHGGSWMSGTVQGYRPLAARIAAASGCSVFSLNYRLAPENPYPLGLEDCVAAYEWITENAPGPSKDHLTKYPHEFVAIAGDSAGGNLTLATALRIRQENFNKLPNALVCLSPATDLTWGSDSMVSKREVDPIINPERLHLVAQAYLQGREKLTHPHVSPLFGDFSDLPRTLIQVGEAEVLLDDATRFADKAQSQGADVSLGIFEDMPHVFQMFAPTVDTASQAIEKIGHFLSN